MRSIDITLPRCYWFWCYRRRRISESNKTWQCTTNWDVNKSDDERGRKRDRVQCIMNESECDDINDGDTTFHHMFCFKMYSLSHFPSYPLIQWLRPYHLHSEYQHTLSVILSPFPFPLTLYLQRLHSKVVPMHSDSRFSTKCFWFSHSASRQNDAV